MTEIQLSTTSIGLLARKILSEANSASILGITSRGIFLKIRNRWVIFLSYEPNRGPLTLNLNQTIRTPINIDKSQSVEIQNGAIALPKANIRIRIEGAIDWIISPHPLPVLNPKDIDNRIRAVGQEVIAQRGGVGLTPMLADLLHIPFLRQPNLPKYLHSIYIRQLHKDLKSPDINQIISALQKFIGLGTGLTPSGDDLISGFLLACNRYQDVLSLPSNLVQINQAMVAMAFQKTSLLSANLIECAAQGQADERLILAIDGMLAGTMDPASCTNHLLSWGNSSGCDALLGMALAAYQTPEIDTTNRCRA